MKETKRNLVTEHIENKRIHLKGIFISFLKLGMVAFGGPAMVANIREMVVVKRNWIDSKTFNAGIALCQTIPGATAMQTAAFSGFKLRGVPGALASFTAFGLPAFIFMLILSIIYSKTSSLPQVISIFSGLRAAIIAIIAHSAFTFARTSLNNYKDVLFAVAIVGLYLLGINPFIVIVIASLAGMLILRTKIMSGDVVQAESKLSARYFLVIILLTAAGLLYLYFSNTGLFNIAVIMLKVDLFAFGGGFNSLPLLYHEIVEARGLLDNTTFMNGIALGQITPGPIVITSTFVGYLTHGVIGAVVATTSIFLPSFLMVILFTGYFEKLNRNVYFNRAVRGIFISFVGLLIYITIQFSSQMHWNVFSILLALAAYVALMFKIKIQWVVIAAVLCSLVFL